MPIQRSELVAHLALHDAEALAQILELSGDTPAPGASPRALAEQITRRLWWAYATPLGLVARSIPLDAIVDHLAHRLRVAGALPSEGDAMERLRALTALMVRRDRQIRLADLDEAAQR